MACSGALNDTPLPTMLMSMWLPIGLQIDAQTGRGEREVGGDVGKLVCGGELRVDHGVGVHHPGVTRACRCDCPEAAVSRGVNVVRRRVEGLVPVALECPKHEAVLGAEDIIEFADALQAVVRRGDGIANKTVGIGQR